MSPASSQPSSRFRNPRCRGIRRERDWSRWRRRLRSRPALPGRSRWMSSSSQTEVGEASESTVAGRGASSALPQKRNPVDAIEILAAVPGINAQVAVLLGAMLQEHERAAGAWQAEWPAFAETLRLAGGAVSRLASLLTGLQVDPERMRRNLDLSGGSIMAEHVVMMLGKRVDPVMARALVDTAVSTASSTGRAFRDVLREDPTITTHLKPEELDAALEPSGYLGVAQLLIDRALAAYRGKKGAG